MRLSLQKLPFALCLSMVAHAASLGALILHGNAVMARYAKGPLVVEVEGLPTTGAAARTRTSPGAHRHARTRAPQSKPDAEGTEKAGAPPLPTGAGEAHDEAASRVVYGEEEVDVAAVPGATPPIRYPRLAYLEGREGDVEVFLVVDASGAVIEAAVTGPAGHGFDEAALEAGRHLRFTPARKGGLPVSVHVHWTCRFRIEG